LLETAFLGRWSSQPLYYHPIHVLSASLTVYRFLGQTEQFYHNSSPNRDVPWEYPASSPAPQHPPVRNYFQSDLGDKADGDRENRTTGKKADYRKADQKRIQKTRPRPRKNQNHL